MLASMIMSKVRNTQILSVTLNYLVRIWKCLGGKGSKLPFQKQKSKKKKISDTCLYLALAGDVVEGEEEVVAVPQVGG